MNRYCSVPYCNSWSKRNPEIPFHLFPKADKNKVCMDTKFGTKYLIDRQKAWILKLGIGKPVTKFMRVCSLHFTQDDYFHRGNNSKRNILKKTAVPSRKLPLQVPCEPRPSRIEKCSRRSAKYILNIPENSSDCTDKDSQHTKRDHVAGQGLRKLLLSRPNYTGPKKFCNFQRQSAPNPTNSGQSVDNIKFCDRTGLWVTPLSRPTDFSIKSVPNSCESPNVSPKVLKERQIGSTHHDVEDFNNTNDNTENSNNLQKIESSSLENNLPKITNVFSLSESEFVQNDFTGCEAVQDTTYGCSFKESKLSCSISEIIPDVDNATDGFTAAQEIKDEPVDVEINRVPLVDNTISDEETADASETASYMQDIIDSIPEINDSNQYVDIPEFVQINNFGPKDLEEFRRQQLKEKEQEENEEGSSSVNELSPDTPSSIPDMNFSDSVFVNGNRMVRYGDEYKLASQADKTPLLKNMLCPVQKSSRFQIQMTLSIAVKKYLKKLPEVIVFEGKEYIKSYERNAYIPHPNQEQEVADCGPKRKRRFKIVPVSDTSQSGKIGVKSKKEKRDPGYDKDVVVLYTSYTTDAYYINDHDYLVNPYKRNKVLINENNGWASLITGKS
ncbi:hypothetical protein NQ317_012996 [Molorchus minor]|uniref:THAP-type domain-containing protein n=1 Tax=Molorchus minor TaxID=1323400 RepID=A0ABQ9J978_9CUCU|nr:hypothetical protein NQ317_012996 [Molorchus minor]